MIHLHNERPELTKGIVAHALDIFYHCEENKKIYIEINTIMEKYKDDRKNIPNINKIRLKIQRIELNNILIRCVLNALPECKRKMIEGKFHLKKSLVSLSMTLCTSSAQIFVWQAEIIGEIEAMIFYKIVAKNFSLEKIINMICVIDKQIDFLENVDENNILYQVDNKFLSFLKLRKMQYNQLYCDLEEYINSQNDLKRKALHYIMSNRNEPIKKTSFKMNINQTSASQYMKEITEKIIVRYPDLFISDFKN